MKLSIKERAAAIVKIAEVHENADNSHWLQDIITHAVEIEERHRLLEETLADLEECYRDLKWCVETKE